MRVKRIDQIEEYIQENKSVSLDKLCEIFEVSKNTLRRDIDVLTKRGTVSKVYGGVTAVETYSNNVKGLIPYTERNIKNQEEKQRIARSAAAHIKSGDTVFIDTGTSTLDILDYLGDISNVTVITNSVLVLSKALNYPTLNVIALPGTLKNGTASMVGLGCIEYLRRYNIKKAFMACTAIAESGASNASAEEYEIKKVALEQSEQHFVLVDHTKFDKVSLMTFCQLSDIDCLITDQMPSEKYTGLFRQHGITLELSRTQD